MTTAIPGGNSKFGVTSWCSTTNNYTDTRVLSQFLLLPVHTIGNEIGVPGYKPVSCMVRYSRIGLDYAMPCSYWNKFRVAI